MQPRGTQAAGGRVRCRGGQPEISEWGGMRGTSLIEVLVTMLILAVGVLGIVALQFKGLQYNHNALTRSQVNLMAYDLIDRMRLNRENVATYVSRLGNWTVTSTAPSCGALTGGQGAADSSCWQLQATRSLPPGSVVRLTGGNPYVLTILWDDREGTQHSVGYSFQL